MTGGTETPRRCRVHCTCLLAIALLLALARLDSLHSAERVNVLLILADDLGFSDVGCYGGEIATPHLDALAREGLRYTQVYNTGRCWPTRAALLTGFHPHSVRRDAVPGIPSGGRGVRPVWAPLLPELLRPAGYRSYHSGKWHLDGPALKSGFDRSLRVEDHDRYFSPREVFRDDERVETARGDAAEYVTTTIADHAIACLKEHAASHADRPFFAFVAFTAPHFPLQAPAADIARHRMRYAVGWDEVRNARWRKLQELGLVSHKLPANETGVGPPYDFPEALAKLGPLEVNRPVPWSDLAVDQRDFQAMKMAIHAAMVERMDREIGRLVEQLQAMGELDRTLICFLSDNGASAEIMVRGDGHDPARPPGSAGTFLSLGPGWSSAANSPLRRHKTWMHEGGIATPFIVRWPRGFAARGENRRAVGHVIDFVPTILELAGQIRPQQWQGAVVPPLPGQSLVPTFARDGAQRQLPLWWLHEGNRAIRVGDWKLVAAGASGPWELYDLGVDRGETTDLSGQFPDRVKELERQWEELRGQFFRQAGGDEAKR